MQIVAHKIEVCSKEVAPTVKLHGIAVGRMERALRGGQRKYQPAATRFNRLKFEIVAKEHLICFGIFAEEKDLRADDHEAFLSY